MSNLEVVFDQDIPSVSILNKYVELFSFICGTSRKWETSCYIENSQTNHAFITSGTTTLLLKCPKCS